MGQNKKISFLFGQHKGQEINSCEAAAALQWYLTKIGPKHWQYWVVEKQLRKVEFMAK